MGRRSQNSLIKKKKADFKRKKQQEKFERKLERKKNKKEGLDNPESEIPMVPLDGPVNAFEMLAEEKSVENNEETDTKI